MAGRPELAFSGESESTVCVRPVPPSAAGVATFAAAVPVSEEPPAPSPVGSEGADEFALGAEAVGPAGSFAPPASVGTLELTTPEPDHPFP